MIQSGGFLGSWLDKLSKKVVTELAIPFAKIILLKVDFALLC